MDLRTEEMQARIVVQRVGMREMQARRTAKMLITLARLVRKLAT
jgi:hypothetical protein